MIWPETVIFSADVKKEWKTSETRNKASIFSTNSFR